MIITSGTPSRGIGTVEAGNHSWVRVAGDQHHAWLETSPPYSGEPVMWATQPVEGTVEVCLVSGDVRIGSPMIEKASLRSLECDFERALRDARLIDLEQGKRYRTGCYVALDWFEADRLSKVSNTPIRVSDATLVHVTGDWAFWSDGKFTTSIGLPRWTQTIRSLSEDAIQLISAAMGSDSGEPECGYAFLARVKKIVTSKVLSRERGRPGGYAAPQMTRLHVELDNGETAILYNYTAGYFEGYEYELCDRPKPAVPTERCSSP